MRVMCAMSGGVDSSVSALLLKEAGHHVVGVTMKLWGGDSDTGCCSVSDVDDARRVAQQLDIDHLVFNFGDDFDRHVVDPYVAAHAAGTTPNPCIECNRSVKFARLAERAELLGFDAVATGHHARIGRSPGGSYTIERGADRAKDQSYVVHMLGQRQLAKTLFPIGDLTKARVRELAARINLRTAAKPDSQDVCFILSASGNDRGGRTAFLGDRIPLHRATVVDTAGHHVGELEAVETVTVGQRKGIGLPGGGPKRYVVDVDVGGRLVTVGDEADLLCDVVDLDAMAWVEQPVVGDVLVQASAHGEPRTATATFEADTLDPDTLDPDAVGHDTVGQGGAMRVVWREPQRRVAAGQSVVLYDLTDTRVLGGGIAS